MRLQNAWRRVVVFGEDFRNPWHFSLVCGYIGLAALLVVAGAGPVDPPLLDVPPGVLVAAV